VAGIDPKRLEAATTKAGREDRGVMKGAATTAAHGTIANPPNLRGPHTTRRGPHTPRRGPYPKTSRAANNAVKHGGDRTPTHRGPYPHKPRAVYCTEIHGTTRRVPRTPWHHCKPGATAVAPKNLSSLWGTGHGLSKEEIPLRLDAHSQAEKQIPWGRVRLRH